MFRAASRCALLGAAGALLVALADFGASWLWLPALSDRAALALRLLALEIPVGALAGSLLGAVDAASESPVRRLATRLGSEERWAPRLWPTPFLLLASPAILAVAWLLFTGGSASRLPMRPLWVALAALCLFACGYVALRAGRRLLSFGAGASRRRAGLVVAGLLAFALSLSTIDQAVLPGHYEYLHGVLTLAAWLSASLAVAIVAVGSRRARRWEEQAPALGLAAIALLTGVLVLDVITLDTNQTVRVALLSPRAPASRSLMLALGPALARRRSHASTAEVDRARRARRERHASVSGTVLEDAHVLLVTIDALRADHLGLYGYRTRPTSAALDRFAAESVVFEMAYAQAPHSSYSLSSLMTSGYLYQRADLGLPLPEETVASVLRTVGRHCAAFYTQGIFHTDGARLARYRDGEFGFGRLSHRNTSAEEKTDEVLSEIRSNRRGGRAFELPLGALLRRPRALPRHLVRDERRRALRQRDPPRGPGVRTAGARGAREARAAADHHRHRRPR